MALPNLISRSPAIWTSLGIGFLALPGLDLEAVVGCTQAPSSLTIRSRSSAHSAVDSQLGPGMGVNRSNEEAYGASEISIKTAAGWMGLGPAAGVERAQPPPRP